MNKTEMLDQLALYAMQSAIIRDGINNAPFLLADRAYQLAEQMLKARENVIKEWDRLQDLANGDIDHVDLPIRVLFCLKSENIYKSAQLTEWTERDIMRIPNMGKKGLQHIKDMMARKGLKLKDQRDDFTSPSSNALNV